MPREIRHVSTPVSGAPHELDRQVVRALRRSDARAARAAEGAPLEPGAPLTLWR
ncbi:hypothetical protein WMF31_30575 [Sorangium sp. So ce1036]|uniref:hypothetical protein n=1 Tax=Sorangium sp. So ce1036 TaxID=3133328 RepID=UPI003F0BBDD6